MNGCAPTMVSGCRSPGPAPGSPLAALLHGVHSTRSNPLYCSLKKVSLLFVYKVKYACTGHTDYQTLVDMWLL